MAKPLVSDELWAFVAPLLSPEPPKPKGGRPRVPDRAALTGIIFVLKTGIPWEMLPPEMAAARGHLLASVAQLAGGRGVGCRASRTLGPTRHSRPDRLEPRRGGLGQHPGPKRGKLVGPNPTDRGKPSTKRHLVVEWTGLPLAARLSGANRHDSMHFEAVLDAISPIRTPSGQRRSRPDKLHADKGYDIPRCRRALTQRRIKVRIARKGRDSSQRFGQHRWMVERTLAWLNRFRRRTVRYERRADIYQAFLTLGCALICFNALQKGF
jgi:transposase